VTSYQRPLDGIRILELGSPVAGPGAAGLSAGPTVEVGFGGGPS
jgi:crotonobetainyl-CoA:carnitine CoA-transferase CaiB-like acyl-CoA transferase